MKADTITNTRFFDFPGFQKYMDELVNNNSCYGELSKEHINATRINALRIKRINKQIEITSNLKYSIESIKDNWDWLILIESWCVDGAQNLPIISKIAAISDKIKLTIKLRDENSAIMDSHLTNGARAMPKLICTERNSNKEIGVWGPRPYSIQKMVNELKLDNPLITHEEFGKHLHLFYAKDKGLSLQNEFACLINEWMKKA